MTRAHENITEFHSNVVPELRKGGTLVLEIKLTQIGESEEVEISRKSSPPRAFKVTYFQY